MRFTRARRQCRHHPGVRMVGEEIAAIGGERACVPDAQPHRLTAGEIADTGSVGGADGLTLFSHRQNFSIPGKVGHEILVATLRAFRAPSGDVFTACAWQDGLEALLPQTDRIDFVRPGAANTPSSAKVWSTTFAIARKTLGELMQPIGDLPERWRVKGFPTDSQLEQMALEGKI